MGQEEGPGRAVPDAVEQAKILGSPQDHSQRVGLPRDDVARRNRHWGRRCRYRHRLADKGSVSLPSSRDGHLGESVRAVDVDPAPLGQAEGRDLSRHDREDPADPGWGLVGHGDGEIGGRAQLGVR